MKFKSWVPTVTGKLSFTIVGRTDWPRRCSFVNHIGVEQAEGGIFLQERYCHDFSLPFIYLGDRASDWLVRKLSYVWKPLVSGRHYFLCKVDAPSITKTREIEGISGEVYAIPVTPAAKPSLKRAQARIHDFKEGDDFLDLVRQVDLDLNSLWPACGRFTLARTGEFSLEMLEARETVDVKMASGAALKAYAEQIFFFVRDIVHRHQHHDGTEDLIVRLHPDDDNWKRSVYFDLFRRVISFKRLRTDFHITNATGILAYTETFRQMFEPVGDKIDYYADNTILSLETAKYELQLKQSKWSNKISVVQTALFGVLGFLLSMAQLIQVSSKPLKEGIDPHPYLLRFGELVVENPHLFVVFTAFGTLAVTGLPGLWKAEGARFVQDTLRVFQSYPRKNTFFGMILFGLVVFVAAVSAILWRF